MSATTRQLAIRPDDIAAVSAIRTLRAEAALRSVTLLRLFEMTTARYPALCGQHTQAALSNIDGPPVAA